MLDPESPVVVWSRTSSIRSVRSGSRVIAGQYVLAEPDTICLLPSTVRLLGIFLTFLVGLKIVDSCKNPLMTSLFAAIVNSLEGSSRGSVSYCKAPEESFNPRYLCPRESMFLYYQCCDQSTFEKNKCCVFVRFWLLFAIICVALSCVIGIGYTVVRYCCLCKPTKRGLGFGADI